jgi:hypothetical protein
MPKAICHTIHSEPLTNLWQRFLAVDEELNAAADARAGKLVSRLFRVLDRIIDQPAVGPVGIATKLRLIGKRRHEYGAEWDDNDDRLLASALTDLEHLNGNGRPMPLPGEGTLTALGGRRQRRRR